MQSTQLYWPRVSGIWQHNQLTLLLALQGNPKFLEIVTNWQKKLGTVDVVLNTWLDVQKKWQALESIFVGSADIRVQLPEDSKRFDVVNADFQASLYWMLQYHKTPLYSDMQLSEHTFTGLCLQHEQLTFCI